MRIKSKRCSGGNCVEVDLDSMPNTVYVYDEHENRCTFTYDEWKEFLLGVKNNEFELN